MMGIVAYVSLTFAQVDALRDFPRGDLRRTLALIVGPELRAHRALHEMRDRGFNVVGASYQEGEHLRTLEVADVLLTRLEEMWDEGLEGVREELTSEWERFFPVEWVRYAGMDPS